MRKHYAGGKCQSCYMRPYARANYRRVKADPARYAKYLEKCRAAKRQKAEQKALAELGTLTAELEDLL